MQPITATQLLAALQHHKGQAKGIHVRELAMQVYGELTVTGAHERAVRKLITELRQHEGHAICAHPAHGYFMAETQTELDHTINFMNARAMTSLMTVSRLRKISINQVLAEIASAQTVNNTTDSSTEPHEEQYDYE